MPVLPPPPVQDAQGSYAWLDWYRQLRNYISQTGSVPWAVIDFAGSNITSIASRSHQNLQALQGGTTGEYYHLTSAEYSTLTQSHAVQSVAVDTSLVDAYPTTIVTATGKTITLPAASPSRVGKDWTVCLATTGTVTIQRAGSDTIVTPISATDTSVVISVQGESITFRCATSTSWIMV